MLEKTTTYNSFISPIGTFTFLPTLARNQITVGFPYYQSDIIKRNLLISPGIKELYFDEKINK